MGIAWPHIEKAKHQHYGTGLDVEPSGQAKEGETEKHMAASPWGRHHANGAELETTEAYRTRQQRLERCCEWPMFHEEPRAKVSKYTWPTWYPPCWKADASSWCWTRRRTVGDNNETDYHREVYWHRCCSTFTPTTSPYTLTLSFIYADDLCIASQGNNFNDIEASHLPRHSDLAVSPSATQLPNTPALCGKVYTRAQAEPGPTRLLPNHLGLPQINELGQCTPTGRYRPSSHQENCCLPHVTHTANDRRQTPTIPSPPSC